MSALEETVDSNTIVFVFHNRTQTKDAKEISDMLEKKGVAAKFLELEKTGDNALDFHMTFFLGWELRVNPDGRFLVFTNDTGFDSLIDRLQKSKKNVIRVAVPIPTKKDATAKKSTSKTRGKRTPLSSKTKTTSQKKTPSSSQKKPTAPKKKSSPSQKKKPAPSPSKSRKTSAWTKKPKQLSKSTTVDGQKPTPLSVLALDERIIGLAKNYSNKCADKPFPRTLARLRNDIKTRLKKHNLDDDTVDKIIAHLRSIGLSPRSESK